MRQGLFRTALAIGIWLCAASGAQAISLGQLSNFETGNFDGWEYGRGQSAGIVNGRLDVDVSDISKNRAVIINESTNWAGDWTSAGIGAVRLFAENTGTETIWLRLGFSATGTRGGAWAVTDDDNMLRLAAGESADTTFSLGDLTLLQGGGTTIEQILSGVAQFRIFSNVALDFRGANNNAVEFALDDITAVPLPAAAWLLGSGAIGLLGLSRRASS